MVLLRSGTLSGCLPHSVNNLNFHETSTKLFTRADLKRQVGLGGIPNRWQARWVAFPENPAKPRNMDDRRARIS
jgi:hypothetical protein